MGLNFQNDVKGQIFFIFVGALIPKSAPDHPAPLNTLYLAMFMRLDRDDVRNILSLTD
jgi:hypothetical protein